MSDIERSEIDFDLLCDSFPKHCTRIKLLARANATFGDVCEDYCLAYKNLKRFETDPNNGWEVEIADFRVVVAELGAELTKLVRSKEISEGVATSIGTRAGDM